MSAIEQPSLPWPAPTEHPPHCQTYLAQVADSEDVMESLRRQPTEVRELLADLTDQRARHRYAAGKWSIKEVLGHIIDTERVLAYRALRFARGDEAPLPGFDQDAWIPTAGFDHRPLGALLDELATVRGATLSLYEGLPAAAIHCSGVADGAPWSVRAVPWILVGHCRHHLAVLSDRYLG